MDNRELWEEFGAVHAESPEQPVRSDTAAPADGDGAMLGRVLVYASMVVVAVAMVVWKRSV
jgi:hypothetical protein